MIEKMSAAQGRSIGTGHIDNVRPPHKTSGAEMSRIGPNTNGVGGSLAGAIDHMVQQGMPIDMQHVTSIRNAIADGQYPVDPTMIADKMVDFERSGSDFS